jgi:hypothetical protein
MLRYHRRIWEAGLPLVGSRTVTRQHAGIAKGAIMTFKKRLGDKLEKWQKVPGRNLLGLLDEALTERLLMV